ncbi:MAG: ABC transporter ATP-binding protein [Prevotellaceae bacterium]|nr:ABC transporter ATP-binding protein [Prevotellaceae bacterium]
MSLIVLSGITKSYRDGEQRIARVLENINLEVKAGDFIAVKGASGAGKTTLLKILGALLMPDAGKYLFDGVEMTAPTLDIPYIRNTKIGFVFQEHRLMPQYNIRENILLPALAYGCKTSSAQNGYAQQLMDITGIASIADKYPHAVSGGEAGRAAICRALMMKPLLVLADEPTGQLDTENATNITSVLSDINKTLNTTIIMVTHSDRTASVARQILTLANGNLSALITDN